MLRVRISSYDARGEFGEDERRMRVARGIAESNSSFLFYNILPMEMYDENPTKTEMVTGHRLLTPSAFSTKEKRATCIFELYKHAGFF